MVEAFAGENVREVEEASHTTAHGLLITTTTTLEVAVP